MHDIDDSINLLNRVLSKVKHDIPTYRASRSNKLALARQEKADGRLMISRKLFVDAFNEDISLLENYKALWDYVDLLGSLDIVSEAVAVLKHMLDNNICENKDRNNLNIWMTNLEMKDALLPPKTLAAIFAKKSSASNLFTLLENYKHSKKQAAKECLL